MSTAPPGATAIHRMVQRCRAGEAPAMVAKMRSGWVLMGERQVFPGYCLLLADPVADHLNALSPARRVQFLADMALIGDALLASTGAIRVNYAIFGNVEPALHAHIFPRHSNEPQATRTAQPWAFDWNSAPAYSDSLHGQLQRRIAAHIDEISAKSIALYP